MVLEKRITPAVDLGNSGGEGLLQRRGEKGDFGCQVIQTGALGPTEDAASGGEGLLQRQHQRWNAASGSERDAGSGR